MPDLPEPLKDLAFDYGCLWTLTVDGKRLHPFRPDPEVITLENLARGLANECRFGSQASQFLSVAEHSMKTADLVALWGFGEELQQAALLHDAAEAYLRDFPRPLKEAFPQYRELEKWWQAVIADRFGLDKHLFESPIIKAADDTLLVMERGLVHPNHESNWVVDLYVRPIDFFDIAYGLFNPSLAYEFFKEHFKKLFGEVS